MKMQTSNVGTCAGLRLAIGFSACLALAGCASEPSEGDMRAAVEKQVSA